LVLRRGHPLTRRGIILGFILGVAGFLSGSLATLGYLRTYVTPCEVTKEAGLQCVGAPPDVQTRWLLFGLRFGPPVSTTKPTAL
jgi:hypothetical protein